MQQGMALSPGRALRIVRALNILHHLEEGAMELVVSQPPSTTV